MWTTKGIIAVIILIASVVTDLKSKKIPNQLIVVSFFISIMSVFFIDGASSIGSVLSSIFAAVIFILPMYLLKALGGGDLKLFIAISPLMSWGVLFQFIFASLVWASVLGIARVVFSKQGSRFFANLWQIILLRKKIDSEKLTKIPFTIAMLLGYLTARTLELTGGVWL